MRFKQLLFVTGLAYGLSICAWATPSLAAKNKNFNRANDATIRRIKNDISSVERSIKQRKSAVSTAKRKIGDYKQAANEATKDRDQAKKAMADAGAAYGKVNASMKEAAKQLTEAFMKSPKMAEAVSELSQLESQTDAQKQKALAPLEQQVSYKMHRAAMVRLKQEQAGATSAAAAGRIARDILDHESKVRTMEKQALSEDKDYNALVEIRDLARQRVAALKSDFESQLESHPKFGKLQASRRSALEKMSTTKKEYTAALRVYAKAYSEYTSAQRAISRAESDIKSMERRRSSLQSDLRNAQRRR